ncbi:MAG: hypothetical protein GY805_20315, partial [Chloroflexi bacterium]|nr:hypothetical protein [Chloroflexota bacterium]
MMREVWGVRFLLTAHMETAVRNKLADLDTVIYQLPTFFNPIFDFSPIINASAHVLPGFQDLLQAMDNWLTNPEMQQHGGIFPEPFAGKTAVSASLIKISQGTLSLSSGLSNTGLSLTAVKPDFISAYHLYQSTDPRTTNPRIFIQSVAAQLANKYPAYNQALREIKEGFQRELAGQKAQFSIQSDGDLPGEEHPYLDIVNQMSVIEAFDRLIVQPWINNAETLDQTQPILILVDGLERMLSHEGATSIPTLLNKISLPPFIHFFLAANNHPELTNAFTNLFIENFYWDGIGQDRRPRRPDANFVADMTIPDGTVIKPEQAFTKTWRMRNTGMRNWNKDFSIVFVEGIPMTEVLSQSVAVLNPGGEADVSVSLTAPTQIGTHLSVWGLRDAQGDFFGDYIWVQIEVDETAEPRQPDSGSGYDNFDIHIGQPLPGPDMRYPITVSSVAGVELQDVE